MEGCQAHPLGGHVYYFCSKSKKWGDAREFCKSQFTHLVTLSSAEENAFVGGKLGESHWIGYYQEWYTFEWDWLWVTGEPMGFDQWDANQPDNGSFGTEEDCVEMRPGGKWNDDECSKSRFFVCEYES